MRYASRSVLAGLLAGTFDIAFASMLALARGQSPEYMLQTIASGILGKSAFQAGTGAAAFGLGCHLLIAIAMASIFSVVGRRWKYVFQHLGRSIVAFGVASWATMQYVVVPLSAAPFRLSNHPVEIGLSLFAHIVLVSLPIGVIVIQRPSSRVPTRWR